MLSYFEPLPPGSVVDQGFFLLAQLKQAGVFAHPKASPEKSTAEVKDSALLHSVHSS